MIGLVTNVAAQSQNVTLSFPIDKKKMSANLRTLLSSVEVCLFFLQLGQPWDIHER